jgi:predicted PurR-regulated permease PerM
MQRSTLNKTVLLLVLFFISAVFMSMIKAFLMAIFLAGLFSALVSPLYRRFVNWYGGRRTLASLTTLLLITLFILLPLAGLMGIVTTQAIKVGESVKPWVQEQIASPTTLLSKLEALPFYDQVLPYRDLIFQKAGEMVGKISRFLIENLQAATLGTVNFLFMTLVMLYTMFFFLMDGDKLIQKILYYLPLENDDEHRMLDRFTSVARATLKGTAVIGILQGGLAGLAFAVVGIPSAVFWSVIMVLLSILPGIGTALIWIPAAIILGTSGHWPQAIGLMVFCGVVVGSVDNFLRPRMVGKDIQMHELLIFFGTLGGIMMFGFVGFIIGPIVAALFTTVWDIYGIAFKDILPETGPSLSRPLLKDESPGSESETDREPVA